MASITAKKSCLDVSTSTLDSRQGDYIKEFQRTTLYLENQIYLTDYFDPKVPPVHGKPQVGTLTV